MAHGQDIYVLDDQGKLVRFEEETLPEVVYVAHPYHWDYVRAEIWQIGGVPFAESEKLLHGLEYCPDRRRWVCVGHIPLPMKRDDEYVGIK